MFGERAPARFVFFGAFADAENLAITLVVHLDRHQQRDVANFSRPAALDLTNLREMLREDALARPTGSTWITIMASEELGYSTVLTRMLFVRRRKPVLWRDL